MEPIANTLRHSISLEQCEDDWKDLPSLVRRHEKASRLWATDTGYGITSVYLDAAGLPDGYVPRVNQLHGLFLGISDEYLKRSEIAFRSVPASFVHNEAQFAQFSRVFGHRRRFILAPHPYHYVLKNYSARPFRQRSGSVFFMPHTVHVNRPRLCIAYALKVLRGLPQKFHPIEICLHPMQVNDKTLGEIRDAGFQSVCAGGRHDPQFLHRFFWIIQRRQYALAADLSTHLIFSSLTGLQIHVVREIPTILWEHAINTMWYAETPPRPFWPLYEEYHAIEPNQHRFRAVSRYITGADILVSPKQLKQIFLQAETWYRERKTPPGQWALSARDWAHIEPGIRRLKAIEQGLRNRLSGNRGRVQPLFLDIWWELIKYDRSFYSEQEH